MSSPGYVHLSSGHINARNQSIAFSNQSSGQPGIQSQANVDFEYRQLFFDHDVNITLAFMCQCFVNFLHIS